MSYKQGSGPHKNMANPEELLLATFQLDMSSNQCGYPLCCPGTQVDSKSNTELRSYNIIST